MSDRYMAIVPFETAWAAFPGRNTEQAAKEMSKHCEATKIDPGGYGGIIMIRPDEKAVEAIFDRAHAARAAAEKAAKVMGK